MQTRIIHQYMATPVLSFTYPGTSHRFFVIHNTYTESPDTIPMDLAMFIKYHLDIRRTLSGFIAGYKDIIDKGCSLFETSFDSYIAEGDKKFLINLVTATDFLVNAENHKDISAQLHDAVMRGEDELALEQIIEEASFKIRHHSYFRSIHYTREWQISASQANEARRAKQKISQDDQLAVGECPLCGEIMEEARLDLLSEWNVGIQSADFYRHFMDKHAMPAAYMPHVYRSHDFYMDYCRSTHQGYLLLTLEGNDLSDELPF